MHEPNIRDHSNDDVACADAADWQSTLSRFCFAWLWPCCAWITSC